MSLTPTLWSLIADVAAARPDHAAIVFGDLRITYAALIRRAAQAAGALWALGLRPGDRIALLAANRPEYLELLLAASRIGATLVPLNTRYGSDDLAHALRVAAPRALVIATRFRHQDFEALMAAAAALGACASIRNVVHLAGDGDAARSEYDALLRRHADAGIPPLDELARDDVLLQFTSGSSGPAKGVRLLQPQLLAAMTRIRDRQSVVASDVALSFLPYFHVFGGAITTLVPLIAGATIVMQPAFDAVASLEAIALHRCTLLYGVGPCYQAWFDLPTFGRYDLSSIRTGVCASGSLAAARIARKVRETIGPLHSHFGMTETAGVGTMSLRDDPPEIATETAGRPLPGVEAGIFVPGSDERVAAEREGELRLRGPVLTPGYLDHPGANAKLFTADGWLRTGDRGWLGTDGALRVLGRLDDRLRIGGENVVPQEVEEVLATHPAIARAFVVGVPDRRLGEIPVAFVVPRVAASVPELAAVRAFCEGRVADFKIPRHVLAIEEVPGGFHKPQRHRLRSLAMERLQIDEPGGDA